MSEAPLNAERMDLDILNTKTSEDQNISEKQQESLNEEKVVIAESASVARTTEDVSIPADTATTELQPSPALTGALEALLGGLDPPTPIALEAPAFPVESTVSIVLEETIQEPAPANTNTNTNDISSHSIDEHIVILSAGSEVPVSNPTNEAPLAENIQEPTGAELPVPTPANQKSIEESIPEPAQATVNRVSSQAIDDDEDIVLPDRTLESPNPPPTNGETLPPQNDQSILPDGAPTEEEHPEWEVDSSPIESSSDDSSDDSSSDESEEGENAYKLLSAEEQARILMQEGGGSDDEDGGKGAKGTGSGYRTKNEVPEVVVPKPDVTITEDMPIKEIGSVENIVDNIVLIKAKTSGEYQVLESGSVLCLENRSVIGVVSETIGRVQQPFYSVMFTNAGEVAEAGLSMGTKVFYPEKHATFVFTQALKAFKGSDASNLHDEEVGADEMEFSDDEAEMEHKKKVKQARLERRGGRTQQNGSSRGGHPLQQSNTYDPSKGLSYDDAEDDGPYRPLSRPAGLANPNTHGEAPQEGQYPPMNNHSQNQNRDSFRGRGRGDRGRGRGDRGRGRGGHQKERRGGGNNGYSQAPQGHQNVGPPQSPTTFQQPQFSPQPVQSSQYPSFPNLAALPGFGGTSEYSPNQPQMQTWPSFVPPPPFPPQQFPQSFQNMPNMSNMSNMPNMPNMANMPIPNMPNMPNMPNVPNSQNNMSNGWPNLSTSGAYYNPAFLSGAQQGNRNQNSSWPQNQRGGGNGRQ